ncbi:Enoyl-CoA hydratase/carnithine racemase [Jatrophihabitans endophyticus]|uniref:Enoyl-CoA hydratase/carnithine racemase n=1 Tax=Jatrophihabitans endophyticus TaxID=1206085 RepID=A0A1M5PUM7_9ACTN|nr:enoyl-CoA hydratase-related protein [Jatrophihabitans endophyticus]SHH04973.1 Enoyl-CoA hydratase/carnithine racemase [Jatrophihabitans endophyticus]
MSEGAPADPVEVTREGRVLVVRIRRPAKRNAIDAAVTAGLDAALNLLQDDPELWAGVLTGSDGGFSAGTDLVAGPGAPTERGGTYGVMRRRRTTPLVAAVEGYAYGGGFELALACDLVVAGETATFALPETTRGVVAASGALFLAPRALPVNVARELLLTGRRLDARRAWSLGLVNEVTAPGEALDRALGLAAEIVRHAPIAQRETLRALDTLGRDEADAGWAATAAAVEALQASADFAEAMAAFRAKRPPVWRNR